MVHDASYGLTAEARAYARERYEKTDQFVRIIAHDVGTSPAKIYQIAKAEGWQLRKDRPPRGLPEALKLDLEAGDAENNVVASKAEHPGANPDIPVADTIAARLEAAVEKQLRKVESLRGESAPRGKRSIEAERVARTLATLTETLSKVRRLRQPGNSSGSHDDDLPADADGFRLALAHRIDAFVRSRMDGGVSERGELPDGEPAAS